MMCSVRFEMFGLSVREAGVFRATFAREFFDRFGVERRPSDHRLEDGGSEAVNIAAEILGLLSDALG